MTNWQTNIFHSRSSSVLFFFFLDNLHNNLGGECMTTQGSPLLSVDSAQRTGGYQRSNTPHSFKKCFLKNQLNTQQRAVKTSQKVRVQI